MEIKLESEGFFRANGLEILSVLCVVAIVKMDGIHLKAKPNNNFATNPSFRSNLNRAVNQ